MKILVIGDSCVDVFVYGTVDRLSPDAPIPILIPHRKTETGGMAANVYENIISLGIDADLVTNEEVITKTRYVEEKTNHQILRVDSEKEKTNRITNLDGIDFSKYSSVIISDYNKGFLNYEDIQKICERHDTVFIDTKKYINDSMLHAKFIKINEIEYNNNIRAQFDLDDFYSKLIVTVGSRGCKYQDKLYSVADIEAKDYSGAGDVFISALTIEYSHSGDINSAIQYANECATIAVQHKGITKIGNYIGNYMGTVK